MRKRRNDQIFTPNNIVNKMLDLVDYNGDNIRNKTIFEPCFGAGAFLFQIVDKVLDYAITQNLDTSATISILDNIVAIEKDKTLFEVTKNNLIEYVKERGINYPWNNLICGDTTRYSFDKKFDICIGNPPFVRTHNLSQEERELIEGRYRFVKGNTDMYVVFFELGLNVLSPNGKLCYITPSSFIKNSSQSGFRHYLAKNNMIESLIDFRSNEVFDNASTYTAITLIDKQRQSNSSCLTNYTAMKDTDTPLFSTQVNLNQFGSKPWIFTDEKDREFLAEINKKKLKLGDLCSIQHGISTNADSVFIVSEDQCDEFEPELLHRVVKGSTLNDKNYIIFPYMYNGTKKKYEQLSESYLQTDFPKTYNYLLSYKPILENRDMDSKTDWFAYARSQGISSVKSPKFAVKNIVSASDDTCKILEVESETAIYSGVLIVVDKPEYYDVIKSTLTSSDFCKYVKLCGKTMGNSYVSFSAKMIKDYKIDSVHN